MPTPADIQTLTTASANADANAKALSKDAETYNVQTAALDKELLKYGIATGSADGSNDPLTVKQQQLDQLNGLNRK